MDRIHQGMYQAAHSDLGTAASLLKNYPIKLGVKTGTAEAFYSGPIQYAQNEPVINATFIGYAPFDNPEIAISVVVPYLDETTWGSESIRIFRDVMTAYFETLSETRQIVNQFDPQTNRNNNTTQNTTQEPVTTTVAPSNP